MTHAAVTALMGTRALTDSDFGLLGNNAASPVTAAMNNSQLTVPVQELANFPDVGIIQLGTERILYTSKSAASGAGNLVVPASPSGRGYDGSSAQAHVVGELAALVVTAYWGNRVVKELVALSTAAVGVLQPGLADYGAAINAAYAALPSDGGTIRLPVGNLPVSTTIALSTPGKQVTIEGHGTSASQTSGTRLRWTGGAAIMLDVGAAGNARTVVLKDFMLDNSGTATVAVRINTVDMMQLRNVMIYPTVGFSQAGILAGDLAGPTNLVMDTVYVRGCAIGLDARSINAHLSSHNARFMHNTVNDLVLGNNAAGTIAVSVHFFGGTFEGAANTTSIKVERVIKASFVGTYHENDGTGYALSVPTSAAMAWGISITGAYFSGTAHGNATTYAIELNNSVAHLSLSDSYFTNYANPSYAIRNTASRRVEATGNDLNSTGMLLATAYGGNVRIGANWEPTGLTHERIPTSVLIEGDLSIGGVTLFESDRDLAVSLIPNADNSLDLGSSTRFFRTGYIKTSLGLGGAPIAAGVIDLTGFGTQLYNPTTNSTQEVIHQPEEGVIGLSARGSIRLYTDTNNNDPTTTQAWEVYTGAPSGGAPTLLARLRKDGFLGLGIGTPLTTLHVVYDGPGGANPRGILHDAINDTAHSAHITGRKARGTRAAPAALQVGDYIAGFTSEGHDGGGWVRSGYLAFVTDAIGGVGSLKTYAEIAVLDGGAIEQRRFTVDVNGVGIGAAQRPMIAPGGTGRLGVTAIGSTGRGIFELATAEADGDLVALGNLQWTDKDSTLTEKRVAAIYATLTGTTPNARGGTIRFATRLEGDNAANALQDKMVLTAAGDLQLGGATLFESDRDLAVSLLPNATDTLEVGSASRAFQAIHTSRDDKPFAAVVFTRGGTYYARSPTGALYASGADFRTVINTAITEVATAGGGAVFIRAGTHTVNGTTTGIQLRSGVWLYGEGKHLTKLEAANGLDTSIVTNFNGGAGDVDCGVIGMTLDGRDDIVGGVGRTQGTCISFNTVTRGTIRDVWARMAYGSCIQLVNCIRTQVSGCIAEGAGNDNLIVQGPTTNGVEVVQLIAFGARAANGATESTNLEIADGATNVNVANCHLSGSASAGLTIHNHASGTWGATTGPTNITVTNVTIDTGGGGGGGVQILAQSANGPRGVSLTNVVVNGQTGTTDGFRIYATGAGTAADLNNITLSACVARGNSRYGFYVQGTNVTLSGCHAASNTDSGFILPGSNGRVMLNACTSNLSGGNGFNIASSNHYLADCTAEANTLAGYQLTSAAEATSLLNCHAINNTGAAVDGFALGTTVTSAPNGVVVIGGSSIGNGRNGYAIYGSWTRIQGARSSGNGVSVTSGHTAAFLVAAGTTSPSDVTLLGVTGVDTTRSSGATRNGLRVQNGASPVTRLTVMGCTFTDTRSGGSRTQDHGINFQGSAGVDMATAVTLTSNTVQNNITGQVTNAPVDAASYAAFNQGAGLADIQLGDVGLRRGAANRLDLDTGDSFNLVSGDLQFGGVTLFESDRDLAVSLIPNADNSLDLGSSTRKYRGLFLGATAPTAANTGQLGYANGGLQVADGGVVRTLLQIGSSVPSEVTLTDDTNRTPSTTRPTLVTVIAHYSAVNPGIEPAATVTVGGTTFTPTPRARNFETVTSRALTFMVGIFVVPPNTAYKVAMSTTGNLTLYAWESTL